MTPIEVADALAPGGRISIPYRDRFSPARALSLECYRPTNHRPGSPVVIVQHGQSRNGREYCDGWIPVDAGIDLAASLSQILLPIVFHKELACTQHKTTSLVRDVTHTRLPDLPRIHGRCAPKLNALVIEMLPI